jgi:hypothetical protein
VILADKSITQTSYNNLIKSLKSILKSPVAQRSIKLSFEIFQQILDNPELANKMYPNELELV